MQNVVGVNPNATEIDGIPCVPSLKELANAAAVSVSVVTPPAVSEKV
jgi:predicted CoA-binding protein